MVNAEIINIYFGFNVRLSVTMFCAKLCAHVHILCAQNQCVRTYIVFCVCLFPSRYNFTKNIYLSCKICFAEILFHFSASLFVFQATNINFFLSRSVRLKLCKPFILLLFYFTRINQSTQTWKNIFFNLHIRKSDSFLFSISNLPSVSRSLLALSLWRSKL